MTLQDFVYQLHQHDKTGHALDHLQRVERLALTILANEPTANPEMTLAIVLLHEIFDTKLGFSIDKSSVNEQLVLAGFTTSEIKTILYSIQHLSFSKNIDTQFTLSLEGQIAQDADRLDAIGALGIARAFYYGGAMGHPLYSQQSPRTQLTEKNYRQSNSCINHFYEKLFKIKDLMNTATGKQLAQEKHEFMWQFIQQFEAEINHSPNGLDWK